MKKKLTVPRVSQYVIDKNHELFNYIDAQTYNAKNLFNLANFHLRQAFIFKSKENPTKEQIELISDMNLAIKNFNTKTSKNFYEKKPGKITAKEKILEDFKENNDCTKEDVKQELTKFEKALEKLKESEYIPQKEVSKENGILSYEFLDYYFKEHLKTEDNPYKMLPAAGAQQVLRTLIKDWKSFFASNKDYKKHPGKYTGRPKLPKYKQKDGRHKISFTNQSCKVKDDSLIFPKTELTLKIGIDIKNSVLKEVRLVPMGSVYKIEAVWDKTFTIANLDFSKHISIDLGLQNFATITNDKGLRPFIVNGKPLLAINQYYNKMKADMQSKLPMMTVKYHNKKTNTDVEKKIQKKWSKKLDTLTLKRNNKINDFMHKTSRHIIKYCLDNNIGNIVIGKNKGWKVSVDIGKRNNQNFTIIPFETFIKMLTYKAEECGICVHTVNEAYTSKSSFLDLDQLPDYKEGDSHKFSGSRVKRGLYKTKGVIINSDINGSLNILRRFDANIFDSKAMEKLLYVPYKANHIKYTLKMVKNQKQPV